MVVDMRLFKASIFIFGVLILLGVILPILGLIVLIGFPYVLYKRKQVRGVN
jgi:hypothetical protein